MCLKKLKCKYLITIWKGDGKYDDRRIEMIENQMKSSEILPPNSRVVDCGRDLFREIYMQIKPSQKIPFNNGRSYKLYLSWLQVASICFHICWLSAPNGKVHGLSSGTFLAFMCWNLIVCISFLSSSPHPLRSGGHLTLCNSACLFHRPIHTARFCTSAFLSRSLEDDLPSFLFNNLAALWFKKLHRSPGQSHSSWLNLQSIALSLRKLCPGTLICWCSREDILVWPLPLCCTSFNPHFRHISGGFSILKV